MKLIIAVCNLGIIVVMTDQNAYNMLILHLVNKIKIKRAEIDCINHLYRQNKSKIDSIINDAIQKENLVDLYQEFYKVAKVCQDCPLIDLVDTSDPDDDLNLESKRKKICDLLYHQLSLKCHPDKSEDKTSQDFVIVNEAHKCQDLTTLIDYSHQYEIICDDPYLYVCLSKDYQQVKMNALGHKQSPVHHIIFEGHLQPIINSLKDIKNLRHRNDELERKIASIQL